MRNLLSAALTIEIDAAAERRDDLMLRLFWRSSRSSGDAKVISLRSVRDTKG